MMDKPPRREHLNRTLVTGDEAVEAALGPRTSPPVVLGARGVIVPATIGLADFPRGGLSRASAPRRSAASTTSPSR